MTQIWYKAKCYFTSMINASYLITVPNMNKNHHVLLWYISQQTLKMYWQNCHNYSNLAQSQILFYIQQRPMYLIMISNIKKIQPVIMEDMHENGHMEWCPGPLSHNLKMFKCRCLLMSWPKYQASSFLDTLSFY